MTVPPQLRKETPKEAVRRLMLGQLRRRRGRLATLGLAILAAASFSVLAASAAIISPAAQKVLCVSNLKEHTCTTPMRLVCHKSPGQTVLRRIPSNAYWMGRWHIDFVPYHHWGPDGPPVEGGRLSIRTPRGVRREEAVVSLPAAPPGKQVLIWARCS